MLLCFLAGYLALRVMKCPARHHVKSEPLPMSTHPWQAPTMPKGIMPGLQAISARLSACLARSLDVVGIAKSAPAPEGLAGLAGLPHEITAEIARCLDFRDFAAVSVAGNATWQRFGVSAEAWHLLGSDYDVDLTRAASTTGAELGETSMKAVASGEELREAFRCSHFHINGQHLFRLGAEAPGVCGEGHAAVLSKVAHVLCGLMPRDGAEAVELTCLAAERALQAHNPSNAEAASAAREFLDVVQRRQDIITATQSDQLENAYSSALQLQALMDIAMEESFEDMDIQSNRSEASVAPPVHRSARILPSSAAVLSPPCVECLPDADLLLEDTHEMQRHRELDALLEKLMLETEQ